MTTPDPTRLALPGELASASGHLPSPHDPSRAPSSAPSPGVSPGVLRHPASPTLPDADPLGLHGILATMAEALKLTPAVTSAPSVPAATSVSSATSVPSSPSLPSAPASVPTSGSPFDLPLRFDDALIGVPGGSYASVPSSFALLDFAPDAPHTPPSAPAPSPTVSGFDRADLHRLEAVEAPSVRAPAASGFDPYALRQEFPILQERVNGHRLVWLDNAATTQKPRAVIDRITRFYERENSNIHRAAHTLAARATDAYESARESVRRFLNAPSARDIVFVRGATEGINLIAQSFGRRNVSAGDEVLITWLEHHANIVPWQMLCDEKGATLKVCPVDDRGQVVLSAWEKLLGPKTRIASLTQVSNALGTVTPAHEMVAMARRHGATVVVDGAQAVSHMRVDVQALDCDFYVFSGHKVFGPTGIGAVFGKGAVLEHTPPWQGGGNMIQDVTFERTTYHGPPARFEAGTGNIADAVGLGAALDWLTRVGIENVHHHEHALLSYGTERLRTVPGLTLVGTAPDKAGVLSFVLAGQKTEEVGGMLDREGIAVRSGHHCAQPILRRFGLEATVRASLAPYNIPEDLDALVDALHRIQAGR